MGDAHKARWSCTKNEDEKLSSLFSSRSRGDDEGEFLGRSGVIFFVNEGDFLGNIASTSARFGL